jgi:hypothetical protein
MRIVCLVALVVLVSACGNTDDSPPAAGTNDARTPRDAQHQGVVGPHGDHTPHHGGMVLMNGDVHYEIVLKSDGRHQVWFSDAMRNELPASVASGVSMDIIRPGTDPENVALAIDDAGEAWVANGRPVTGDGVMIKVRYALQGTPHEIEVPFVPSRTEGGP